MGLDLHAEEAERKQLPAAFSRPCYPLQVAPTAPKQPTATPPPRFHRV